MAKTSKNNKDMAIQQCLEAVGHVLGDYSDILNKEQTSLLQKEFDRLKKQRELVNTILRDTGSLTLKIAVVGTFSCGKSSFINSILGDQVAPVEIKPMTHGLTSFVYSANEHYDADGKSITREEYQSMVQDGSNETKHFIVHYPCERLKSLEFIDSPGIGSVSEDKDDTRPLSVAQRDDELSKQSIAQADVVFFLSNITEGVIPDNAFQYLKSICRQEDGSVNPNRRVYIVLTWADRKTEKEREIICEKIKDLCQKEELNIREYRVYSSKPIESMKLEKHKVFFTQAKEELFGTVRNLQGIGQELLSHRNSFDVVLWNLHFKQFLYKFQTVIDVSVEELSRSKKQRDKLLKKNTEALLEEATAYLCEVFDRKYSENSSFLLRDEEHTFSDDVISVIYNGDLVTLSEGEIFDIKRKLISLGEQYELPLENLLDNSSFLSAETNVSTDPSRLYCKISRYPNNGYFVLNSLADQYLKICVSILDKVGGPWKEMLWGNEERSSYMNKKRKKIRDTFNKYFYSGAHDIFYGSSFAPQLQTKIAKPQLKEIQDRIKKLELYKKGIDSFLNQQQIAVGVENTPQTVTVDDILNML